MARSRLVYASHSAAMCILMACGDVAGPLSERSGPFASMSAGFGGCGLTPLGTLFCWPVDSSRLIPTIVRFPESVVLTHVGAGGAICVMDQAHTVFCLGADRVPVPVVMPAGETLKMIAVGNSVCGLNPQGLAYCWGGNSDGQLGDGTKTDRPTPVPVVMPAGQSFTALGLSTGVYNHSCALTPAGTAYCWGANFSGQLGDSTTTDRTIPVAVVMPADETFASISIGGYHSCGLTAAGVAYCWGTNVRGRLGDGTTTDRWVPTPVLMPPGVTFTQLSAGLDETCGLTAAGAAYCWGRNAYGQLGDGTTVLERLEPVAVVMPSAITFASLVAGWSFACGLTSGGDAYCWGLNASGRLGDGTTTNRSTPVRVVQ